jgi:hypothetical protein
MKLILKGMTIYMLSLLLTIIMATTMPLKARKGQPIEMRKCKNSAMLRAIQLLSFNSYVYQIFIHK